MDHCFIAGSVIALISGRLECLPDAQVDLMQDGLVVASQRTDAFGDFRFDGLQRHPGKRELKLFHATAGAARRVVHLAEASVVIDPVNLAT